MADTGTDIACVSDLDPTFAVVGGARATAQALARRLTTPRGGLYYDGEYGFDLRRLVNADFSSSLAFRAAAAIEAECLKDERVSSCSATVTFAEGSDTLTVKVDARSSDGPLRLTLGVSAVSVTVLGGV